MHVDWTVAGTIAALVIFNLPIAVVAVRLPFVKQLSDALCEKDANGAASGALSYSRVTGLAGAVIVTSFFWVIGNIVLVKAITNVGEVKDITSNVGSLFLVGSALFLPYAFNQLKSVFGGGGSSVGTGDGDGDGNATNGEDGGADAQTAPSNSIVSSSTPSSLPAS